MSIGVAIFHDDGALLEDVADAVDRADGIHLIAINEARADADVVLAGGRALQNAPPLDAGLVVLSRGSDIHDARAGFEAGARGWVRWPDDAGDLTRAISRAGAYGAREAPLGRLVVVAGARGGAGASTVAALVAAAEPQSLVVDLTGGQIAFAPESVARDGLARALAAPVADVVERVAEPHASGRALYTPEPDGDLDSRAVAAVVEAARRAAPLVVVDAGRVRAGAEVWGGDLLVVLADDVASLRSARALLDAQTEASFVLNRMRRRSLHVRHVQRALGTQPLVILGPDRALTRAADLGRLPKRVVRIVGKAVHA